jgi:hypothetical protein
MRLLGTVIVDCYDGSSSMFSFWFSTPADNCLGCTAMIDFRTQFSHYYYSAGEEEACYETGAVMDLWRLSTSLLSYVRAMEDLYYLSLIVFESRYCRKEKGIC